MNKMGTIAIYATGGIIGAYLLLSLGISAAGFQAGGVVAGSIAAGIQSSIGNVANGSLFALLQSVGAARTIFGKSPVISCAGVVALAAWLLLRK